MSRHFDKDKLTAALVTAVVAALVLLFLIFGGLVYDKALLDMPPRDQLATLQEDELFIEPEILKEDLGEPDAVEQDEPAPTIQGEPKPDVVENTRRVEPGKNDKPAPPVEKPVTQKTESPVKATEPKATDEEKQEVTSKIAKGFSGRNGAVDGSGSDGAGGTGVGIAGVASGRTFKGCPKPKVSLRHKVTVTVVVEINAEGRVVSAHAKGGADASIRKACEQAAMGARWSEKKDAPSTKGTITFSITPK